MTGEIQVLNVGNGDSILVHLTKPGAELVMVIDGGEYNHYTQTVKPALQQLLQRTGKTAPDIVVATHFDSDHISGLIPLVMEYKDGIQELWIHRAAHLTDYAHILVEDKRKPKNIEQFEEYSFDESLLANKPLNTHSDEVLAQASLVLETLDQLNELLSIVPAKVREVFYGDSFTGWPEIRVLGPTTSYYNTLFPQHKELEQMVLEELTPLLTESQQASGNRFFTMASNGLNPCTFLKTEKETRLTPTNKASIIIAIDSTRGRFLFTGDAGIASFKAIPNWQEELKDLFWLKIPHHGSSNNISAELINILRPQYADNSGDRYEDLAVIRCLERNAKSVRSTKRNGTLTTTI